ncbi:vWA domain-containing protein [Halosimplex pelagicum]|uniref:VWA domain-containing protein n=1 Tax=Halosimplex pelagicum TaxID=869886 RepID=A0A7D5PDK1_9EURY|nr:VWA domain-containing protein [Halosimplex pelagicum]QLH84242.1 VWA domain-containing protein [Halosimplex pelagicum]
MVAIETDVNRPYVPADGATLTATVDVEPGTGSGSRERHILLCLDTSGSMDGAKLDQAREGASWVFGLLEPDDYVGIVAFDSDAEVVMRPQRWGDTAREDAMHRVEQLGAGGGTDMYDGLDSARAALDSLGYRPETDDAVRRVLLLSDGKDNNHEPADFRDLAKDIDGSGIRILSAGIGTDYDEETIRTLGTTARGEWAHLESPGDIESFFGDAVEQAQSVVATEASLELDAAAGVEVSEVYRALPQAQEVDVNWSGNAATVPLPDLAERENQRVVLKVHAPAREELGEHSLVDVTLTASGERASDRIAAEYTDDNAALAEHNEEVSLDHRQTVVRTELGKGNVAAAETEVEKMTRIHGEDTAVVEEAQRQTRLVEEGGRDERESATRIVDDSRIE